MSPRKPRTLKIATARQLKALRTPMRQEVVRALKQLGAATVKELAEDIGRQPASLYYHVHELAAAGIALESKRRVGGRDEAVYELSAERIVIDRGKRSAAFIDALVDTQRATLRTAERELEAAVRSHDGDGPEGAGLMRLAVRLSPARAKELTKMLQDVVAFMEENNDPGAERGYSLTAALVRLPE